VEAHSSPANPREVAAGVVHQLRRNSRANIWSWAHRLSPAEIHRVRRATEDVARFFYSDADWRIPGTSTVVALPGRSSRGVRGNLHSQAPTQNLGPRGQ
jgi:hypothetical protein